jgi:hypothetical protein
MARCDAVELVERVEFTRKKEGVTCRVLRRKKEVLPRKAAILPIAQ